MPPSLASCARSVESLEREWGGTGEWHRLAPYPVPREASPTDSIGIWLERWSLPRGIVELRRVSAEQTIVATVGDDGCSPHMVTHRRSFDASATAGSLTDARLRELVGSRRAGMIYVWSPRMPLSVRGLAEARAAALSLGMDFTAAVAEAPASELRGVDASPADEQMLNSIELVYRNATIHYPTAIFYRDGALLGSAIPGFKRRETYVELGREVGAPRASTTSPSTPALWIDHSAKLTTIRTIATVRLVGFFFKPVAGTDLVTYTSNNHSFIFDLATRREWPIPGTVDPVPTPDGRFVTRPGLRFHTISALQAGDTIPVFVDAEVPDEYQTVSILSQSKTRLRYRVVTGWRMGVRLRDYDVVLGTGGNASRIEPLGTPSTPCADRRFVLPISARSGREIGVYDMASGTNGIIEITDDGRCEERLDLGFASGKLSFSFDGTKVAFATSRIDVDAEGRLLKPDELFYKDALVLTRKTGRLVSLSSNRAQAGMTFPEFLPDGRSIVLEQASRARPVELFRVIQVR